MSEAKPEASLYGEVEELGGCDMEIDRTKFGREKQSVKATEREERENRSREILDQQRQAAVK